MAEWREKDGDSPGIVCGEAIRRDLSVYLAVNAVATVPEIYDDPHYGTRSRPSRFKAPKTRESPGDHVGYKGAIGWVLNTHIVNPHSVEHSLDKTDLKPPKSWRGR